jgi:hypothetical protein
MYWATDTKQVFRWNGAAWVDESASIPGGAGGSVALATFPGSTIAPNDLTLDTIYDYTLPGGTLGAKGGFKLTFNTDTTVTAGRSITVYAGIVGGEFQMFIDNTPGGLRTVEFWFLNKTAATNSESWLVSGGTGPTIITNNNAASVVDTTVDQHIIVQCQKTLAGDFAHFYNGYITRL